MILNGITVINTIAIPIYGHTFVFYIPLIFFVVSVLMFSGAITWNYFTGTSVDDTPGWYIIISFVLIILAVIGAFIQPGRVQISTRYQYVVTVSDDVGFNEFNRAYKILEVDGNLYTIEERDTNADS